MFEFFFFGLIFEFYIGKFYRSNVAEGITSFLVKTLTSSRLKRGGKTKNAFKIMSLFVNFVKAEYHAIHFLKEK